MSGPPQLQVIGERAIEQLGKLLGAPAERVTGIHKSDHGWSATVEVLELHRVPETSDVLADYEVELNGKGLVVGFRRTRRFLRSELEPH